VTHATEQHGFDAPLTSLGDLTVAVGSIIVSATRR